MQFLLKNLITTYILEYIKTSSLYVYIYKLQTSTLLMLVIKRVDSCTLSLVTFAIEVP